MKNKNLITMVAVFAIILVVYILAFLLIPFNKSLSSWLAFGFTIFAFVVGTGITAFAFGKKELKSKFYGLPIFKIGIIYVAVQLVLGIIICIIAAFVAVPFWVALLIFIIALAVFAIAFIGVSGARSAIEEIETQEEIKTQTHKVFSLSIDGIVDICEDESVKVKLSKLAEKFKYSDPVSSSETEEIEDEIAVGLDNLRGFIKSKDYSAAATKIQEIDNLLSERNRICKTYKK
jgi:type II secretory pathway pseudopilin PulG